MGLRQERMADQIRDTLAVCFSGGQMADPRLSQVTITAVKLSGDLQIAKVYFRIYSGGSEEIAKARTGLGSSAFLGGSTFGASIFGAGAGGISTTGNNEAFATK